MGISYAGEATGLHFNLRSEIVASIATLLLLLQAGSEPDLNLVLPPFEYTPLEFTSIRLSFGSAILRRLRARSPLSLNAASPRAESETIIPARGHLRDGIACLVIDGWRGNLLRQLDQR